MCERKGRRGRGAERIVCEVFLKDEEYV